MVLQPWPKSIVRLGPGVAIVHNSNYKCRVKSHPAKTQLFFKLQPITLSSRRHLHPHGMVWVAVIHYSNCNCKVKIHPAKTPLFFKLPHGMVWVAIVHYSNCKCKVGIPSRNRKSWGRAGGCTLYNLIPPDSSLIHPKGCIRKYIPRDVSGNTSLRGCLGLTVLINHSPVMIQKNDTENFSLLGPKSQQIDNMVLGELFVPKYNWHPDRLLRKSHHDNGDNDGGCG